jgi:hypothetical protein
VRLDVPNLSDAGVLGQLTTRPDLVTAIRTSTGARSSDVPFLLLPMRIETRFAQAEVPAAPSLTGQSTAAALADTVAGAAARLEGIAGGDHATVLPANWKARKQFKREVEDPIVAAAQADLAAVAQAVGEDGQGLLRDLAGGSPGDAAAVAEAVARLVRALLGARTALSRLRSDYHRRRLLALLDEVTGPATRLAAQAPARARAAAALGGAALDGVPGHRLTDSALAYDKLDALLADPRALTAAPGRLARARQLCTEIAAVPPQWKARLLVDAAVGGAPAELTEAIEALATTSESAGAAVRAGLTRVVDQLKVRVFPDDVAVQTHEKDLTQDELEAGAAYWSARASHGGDETAARAAWRALCAKHDPNRAAWIARQTEPKAPAGGGARDAAVTAVLEALKRLRLRLDEVARTPGRRESALAKAVEQARDTLRALNRAPAGAIERIRAEVATLLPQLRGVIEASPVVDPGMLAGLREAADAIEVADAVPVRPVRPVRLAMWTTPPRARLLPDRFVVVTVAPDGRVSHIAVGNQVPADLPLGLDPDEQPLADGGLPVALRWMTDYAVAESNGMAVTLEITPQEAREGFARVYVLGLAPGDDPATAATELAALLDGHHYGPTGLAFVQVGTPTNATEQRPSGYRSRRDPDAAYDVEQAGRLVTPGLATGDGARLARALGVPADVFDHVAGADDAGIDAAVAASTALWPATMGYALAEELGSLVGMDARERLRRRAVRYALGRGTLPSIRVGSQPYGVVTTTAFSRWVPKDPAGVAAAEAEERVLQDVLTTMWTDWTAVRDAAVPHTHSEHVADPQQHVLQVLGLEATAASFEQRFTVNAGRRGAGIAQTTLHIGLPPDGSAGPAAGAYALLDRFADVLRRAGKGSGPLRVIGPNGKQGAVAAPWADLYDRLETSRGYEVRLLRDTVPLKIAGAPADLSARVADLLAAPLVDLAQRPAGDARKQPLVLLLLRQALLAQAREVALQIAVAERLLDADLLARLGSGDLFRFVTRSGDVRLSRWSVLLAELARVLSVLPAPPAGGPLILASPLPAYLTGSHRDRLADYVARRGDNPLATNFPTPGARKHAALFAPAVEHATAVSALAALPPAQVDQLVTEHLDVCSHRLDAWLLSLPAARLDAMRTAQPAPGIHAGAFGWVEDLRPRPTLPAASAVPPVLDTDPTRPPIRFDQANQGFVHAPSLNHAVTAAVLRSGYGAEQAAGAAAGSTTPRQLAVNLSSRRTRAALDVLDGIAAGNELGALLGYQFERDLHEAPGGGIGLDAYLPRLRRAFPTAVPVLGPDGTMVAGSGSGQAGGGDGDQRAERLVVDGLRLLQAVLRRITRGEGILLSDLRAGSYAAWPYGLADTAGPMLPDRTQSAALEAVLTAIDHLADTIDAVGDLVLTEGVYQLVQGNHVRAAAALSALAEGKAPPRPEVVDTPVPGRRVEHRLLLQLPPVADPASPGAVAPGWDLVPLTPRAAAEPTLNRWLGTLIGPPGATRIRLVDADGRRAREVTLTALGWQPVDLLACVHDGFEDGLAELAARALDAVRPVDVRDGEPAPVFQVDLEMPHDAADDGIWPDSVRSLPETAGLLEQVAATLVAGRPADAGDFLLADTAPASVAAVRTAGAGGIDTGQLAARAVAAVEALEALGVRLLGLLSDNAPGNAAGLAADPVTTVETYRDTYRGGAARGEHLARLDALWLRRADLRDAVLAAGSFGIRGVTPPTRWLSRDQVATELLEAAEGAYFAVVTRLTAACGAGKPRDVLRQVFGDSLPVLPLFTPRNPEELTAGLAASVTADPPGVAVSRWLAGVAEVREAAGSLSTALVLGDAFGTPPPSGRPVQLPVVPGDAWLGETFVATQPPGDRLSLVVLGAEWLDPAGSCAAVLVDSWSEVIPTGTVTTGLTFHYDSPDAAPPQALLLAVPPVAGQWRWEDLLLTLHETLELAKNRAVEPEHLQYLVYGQLLPGLLGEVPSSGADGDLPSSGRPGVGTGGHRVVLDFADARAARGGS